MVNFSPLAALPGKEPVRMFQRKDKYLVLAKNQTPDHRVCSLVAIHTAPFHILFFWD
jgi:hypothetical protein